MVEAVVTPANNDAWPLIVVVGPTASGKSSLAVALAELLQGEPAFAGGEIVSCDSVAVYKLMDIGSAKPNAEDRARVPHHCLDLYCPNEPCTAGDYARAARAVIAEIRGRGRVPIVAGGTGLYLRALLEGLAPAPPRDEALRERLREREASRGPGYLHRLLHRLDARAAATIHANDTPKLIRSIEVTLAAHTPQTAQWAAGREPLQGYRVLKLGLAPAREKLYERIDARCEQMFFRGLVEETSMLREKFGDDCPTLGALGYAQSLAVLHGELSREQALAATQQGHRNYAKRQGTWFRRESGMNWLQGFGDETDTRAEALKLAYDHVSCEARPHS
jgi:tRNA dimethylallyltransferase